MSGSEFSDRAVARIRAIEFFSGIGAFAEAVRGATVEIVAAFDQSSQANDVYRANFGMTPRSRNLDSLKHTEIPPADLWWMSPPCTPFSRRGHRRDDQDPRAVSFLNLISAIPKLLPQTILLENVGGFPDSNVHARLCATLGASGYRQAELALCPTQFGVPMRRPRHFVMASRTCPFSDSAVPDGAPAALRSYLEADPADSLLVPDRIVARYGNSYDIVDPAQPDAEAICFTSGYYRCQKASGSFVGLPDGRIRRFSPREILNLLGFSAAFTFPDHIPLPAQWRLAGNSVDVRAIRYLLARALWTDT